MFRIGQVADKVGYSPESIRHYESIGLLKPYTRTSSGQRMFDQCDVDRLLLIKSFRRVGMSLKDIHSVLHAGDHENFCLRLESLYIKYFNLLQEKRREIDICEEELMHMKSKCASCEYYKYIKDGTAK